MALSNNNHETDIEYERVEELLAEDEIESSASELQGILAGMVSAGLDLKANGWPDLIAEMITDTGEVSAEVNQIVLALAAWTSSEMNESDTLAPMLLPDDNYPAIDQLESIILWCQGFLLGFGLQMGDKPIENEDIKEALTDLADISQLALEADDDEETLSALSTVTEHVRVAVQVIHWEIVVKSQASVAETAPENETLH